MRRNRYCRVLAIGLAGAGLALLTAGAAGADEFALRYTLDPGGPPIPTFGKELLAADAPLQELKLPRFRSPKPIFLTARLGDGADPSYTFALDESVPGSGHDLLYADTRHVRDLTGREPIRLTRWGFQRGFQAVPLLIEVGGSRMLYHAAIIAAGHAGQATGYRLQSWGYYSGEASIGGKRLPVALLDFNSNGRYNDRFQGYGPDGVGDVLLVDVQQDGRFEPGPEFASPEFRPCARRLQVDGEYYDLDVRPDGAGFRLAPSTAPLATLSSPYSRFGLMLQSSDGMLIVKSEDGQLRVPAGDYRIYAWQVEERDPKGVVWVARGAREGDGQAAPRLEVRGDRALPRLGAPLSARLQIQPAGGRELQFELQLAGASGETIADLTRGGQRVPEPRVRILDARGRQIANVPFHYG